MEEIFQTVADCMHIRPLKTEDKQRGFENLRAAFCQLSLSHTLKPAYSIFSLTTVHIERTNLHKGL